MQIAALFSGRTSTRTSWLASLALVAAMLLVPAVAAPAQAAIDPCGPAGNKISCENSKPGSPRSEWDDYYGRRVRDASRASRPTSRVNVGQRVDFKIDTDASRVHDRHLPHRLLRRRRRPEGRHRHAVGSLPQNQPHVHHRRRDRSSTTAATGPSRRRGTCPSTAVSGVYIARLHRADLDESSHITFIVRDDASHERRRLPDRRHHLAGLQHLRRLQLLPGRRQRPRLQALLQPADADPRRHRRPRLLLRQRVPDGALPGEERLRRQLHLRRRHRPPRQPAASTTRRTSPSGTTSTGAVRSAPTSRRPATPGST